MRGQILSHIHICIALYWLAKCYLLWPQPLQPRHHMYIWSSLTLFDFQSNLDPSLFEVLPGFAQSLASSILAQYRLCIVRFSCPLNSWLFIGSPFVEPVQQVCAMGTDDQQQLSLPFEESRDWFLGNLLDSASTVTCVMYFQKCLQVACDRIVLDWPNLLRGQIFKITKIFTCIQ